MEYENLAPLRQEIERCVRCAACQAGCPTYEYSLTETLSARGRIRMAKALLDGALKPSARLTADFDMCLSCMACMEACPARIDTVAIFQAARADLAMWRGAGVFQRLIFRHVLPYPARLKTLAKMVGLAAMVYQKAPEALVRFLPFTFHGRRRTVPNLLQPGLRERLPSAQIPGWRAPLRRVAYFSGCMTDLAYPETGLAAIRALDQAGMEVIYPGNQVCCGAPAWFAGDNQTARRLVRQNMAAMAGLDVEAVVVSCATCGSMLRQLLPEMAEDRAAGARLAAKVTDFSKLMVEMGVESALAGIKGGGKLRVTYHDPCHLKRGMGVFKEPRALIRSVPNVEFVEMEGADACCGGAGAFTLAHNEESARFGAAKAAAVAATGADVVVTECPSCQLQLACAMARAGVNIPALSPAELLSIAMRGDGGGEPAPYLIRGQARNDMSR